MKYRSTEKRLTAAAAFFIFIFVVLIIRYFLIARDTKYAGMTMNYGKYNLEIENGCGMIYDRNFNPLVNVETEYVIATANITDNKELFEIAVDKDLFNELVEKREPFKFRSTKKYVDSLYTTSFEIPVRYSKNQLAQHLIGYSNESGAVGLEYAYKGLLTDTKSVNTVSYQSDGFGNILIGEGKDVEYGEKITSGIVTTIDSDIQHICEKSGRGIERGAIVVTDIHNGDIVAMSSFPSYSVYNLEEAVNDANSPMINRCLYSYSVGSIFKLVTSCQAIKSGLMDFKYECTGSIDVCGKEFKCHQHSGHGMQDMTQAMTNSCNTYFIALSQQLDISEFRETAFTLGFGREIQLCAGIVGSGGNLTSEDELSIPAELANFSFGQGMLTATPLQISQMTCAIANDGNMPILRVIRGLTADGISIENEKEPRLAYTMDKKTACALRRLMAAAINNNDDSNAKPYNIMAAGKTSTAQTGQYSEDGTEICNAWITGYFPVNEPKYAVTVLIENGGYGNTSAAPVFREIIENIVKIEKSN